MAEIRPKRKARPCYEGFRRECPPVSRVPTGCD